MQSDSIQWEILPDGQISITTDQVSGANHVSADKLLQRIFDLAGGEVKTRKRTRLELGNSLVAAMEKHCADGHVHH